MQSTTPSLKPHHEQRASRPALTFVSETARKESFAAALDALRDEVEADLGETDIAYMRGVRKTSRRLELLGRGFIHFSFEPLGWGVGVIALSAHKLLELIEIGHTVLHGTYDPLLAGSGRETEVAQLHSKAFVWKAPIDEASWRSSHNLRHHQFTNVAGRDPDLDFGTLRLGSRVPFRQVHRLQPLSNFVTWTYFSAAINTHVTGVLELYAGNAGQTGARARAGSWTRHWTALRKFARYYAREYLLFPALAGPLCWKVLLGNAASELLRDGYAGATIYCGHVGASEYPAGTHAKGRAEWYLMQVEGSRDFEVSGVVALLCGGLERQIEHHLFPRLPPNRLRTIAPRVRDICQDHGVTYRSDSWPHVLREVLTRLRALASPDAR